MPSDDSQIRLTAEVPAAAAGRRVDQVATELFERYSRANISRWLQSGALQVDGRQVAPKHKLAGGETLRLEAELEDRERWHVPQAIPLDLLFEDEHVIVLAKPAGLVVHPGAGNPDGTLVNALLAHRPELAKVPRAGVVHRLDKDTSGVMVVATSLTAHRVLVEAIAARAVHREYVAFVEGVMTAGADYDGAIGRHPQVRTRQAVREDGKPARTTVRVVQRYRAHTQIVATLHSGRTHQIRVHSAHAGYPLIGDSLYGARGRVAPAADPQTADVIRAFPRQALHAAELQFAHPVSGDVLAFGADWPDDLTALEMALLQDAADHASR